MLLGVRTIPTKPAHMAKHSEDKMMNKPTTILTGDHRPTHISPVILGRDFYRYHPVACQLKSDDDEIVMWTDGAISFGGYEADTNDGIRAGEKAAILDTSGNYVRYCRLSDWIEAGNDKP